MSELQEYIETKRKENTEYCKDWREKNRVKIRAYNREYNRLYRKKNGYYNEENSKKRNPIKVEARRLFHNALKRGDIKKLNCEICNSPKSQAHHDDYSKPLEVKWLCALHHKERHKFIDKEI